MICDYCNKHILGEYVIDMWGQKYHAFHHCKAVKCGCCSCIILPTTFSSSMKLNDRRRICANCSKDAIVSNDQLDLCVKALFRFYEMGNIKLPVNNIRINLVSCQELPNKGLGEVTTNFINSYHIKILQGLNKTLTCGVLAHELMHIVLIEGQYKFSHIETEGLCELASYFSYKKMNTDIASKWIERMEQNTDPVYGDGFRIMKSRVQKYKSLQQFLSSYKING